MVELLRNFLTKYFHVDKHNSSVRTELMAGITNYFTIIYLVILVPEVLMGAFPEAWDANGDIIASAILSNGLTANEMLVALTAVCFIAAGIGSILMGTLINVPFVQGPSLAIGTFVTYTICRHFGYTYNQALAIVFISGVCFFILSITGIEKRIHKSMPNNLKYAVTAGIGMFIAFTGLTKSHIISSSNGGYAQLFNMMDFFNPDTKSAWLAIFGIIFITVLLKKHVHGAIFIGKILCIIIAIPLGLIKTLESGVFQYNIRITEVIFKLDFNGLINFESPTTIFQSVSTVMIMVFAICMMDIFETISMLITTDNYVNRNNDETSVKKRIPQILEIDAATTSIGAMLGSTSISTYIESTTGIIEGGRTGLTSVVTGVLFLMTVSIAPVAGFVPSAATATTLVVAGVLMMNVIKFIDFEDPAEAVPAFFTMFMMPITNSLLIGLSFGVIMYIVIHLFLGKGNRLNYTIYLLGMLFFITLVFLPR